VSATLEARTALRQLAAEAGTVVKSARMNPTQKKARLDGIEAEMKAAKETIEMHESAGRLMVGGSSIDSGEGGYQFAAGAKSFGGPPLSVDTEQLQALHGAAKSKQSLRVETKAALDLDPSIPATLTPGLLAFRREPNRVASLFPSRPMPGPSMEYLRHASNTGAAGTVAAGAAKPEIVPVVDVIIATARKIAAHIGVNDESLLDFTATGAYIGNELVRAITATENTQLLSGNGVAPNLQGILGVSGVLTRTQAVAPETLLDTLELALNDLRVGSAFTEATGVVMHPNDFSAARLLKNTQGEYLLGHPTDSEPATLWGKPVVVTTDIAAKTVLVGNFAEGGEVLYRQGVTIETGSAGTDWTSNITRFRAEERLTLAVYRPSMFVKVTLL